MEFYQNSKVVFNEMYFSGFPFESKFLNFFSYLF